MTEQDILIGAAAYEYERDGLVSTTTYMALTAIGCDADQIISDIEEAKYGK